MDQRGLSQIIIVLLIILVAGLVGGAYFFGTQQNNSPQIQPYPVDTPLPQVSTAPTLKPTPKNTATASAQPNGTSLKNIKYTLPVNWKATLSADSLHIGSDEGGFLEIKAYIYDGQPKKDFYCSKVDYCISTTTLTDIKVGNIMGSRADGLDNSGGGPDYLGSKGGMFYILNTYTAPNDTSSGTKLQQLLNSLVF